MDKNLEEIRQRIDDIDSQLLALINERVACAQKIGAIKLGSPDTRVYRPEREAQILRRLLSENNGPLDDEIVARLFREVMSIGRGAEQQIRVGTLGPAGTYSQTAASKHFGQSVEIILAPTIEEVFRKVETNNVQFGVVPVENSTEGGISSTLNCLLDVKVSLCAEVYLPIHHCLLSTKASLGPLSRVYAHSQSLAQCRRWLAENIPDVETIAVASNAEAAQRAVHEKDAGAIAGEMAAEQYDLKILFRNVEDRVDNTTRFLVISKNDQPLPSGDDKTSLVLYAKNRPGALSQLLEPLARHGIDLSRIESRPSPLGEWDYIFFVDIVGHAQDPIIIQGLDELERQAAFVQRLGSYPKAVI